MFMPRLTSCLLMFSVFVQFMMVSLSCVYQMIILALLVLVKMEQLVKQLLTTGLTRVTVLKDFQEQDVKVGNTLFNLNLFNIHLVLK